MYDLVHVSHQLMTGDTMADILKLSNLCILKVVSLTQPLRIYGLSPVYHMAKLARSL